jgi:hypothetical protein
MRNIIIGSIGIVGVVGLFGAVAQAEERAPEQYGKDLAAAAHDGWRMAKIDVHENVDGDGDVSLAITMQKDEQAQRFTLEMEDGGETIVGYERNDVPAPKEVRIYHSAEEIVSVLSDSKPVKVYEECGQYYMRTTGRDVTIDPFDYHVVALTVRGDRAQRALAKELKRDVAAGLKLDTVEEATDAEAPTLAITMGNLDGARVIRAEHDDGGRIVALEVWTMPLPPVADPVRAHRRSLDTLRAAREVRALKLVDRPGFGGHDAPHLVGITDGRSFSIDLSDVEPTPADETAGC